MSRLHLSSKSLQGVKRDIDILDGPRDGWKHPAHPDSYNHQYEKKTNKKQNKISAIIIIIIIT